MGIVRAEQMHVCCEHHDAFRGSMRLGTFRGRRIGIVSEWHNRGQGTVGRYLRSALEDCGHQTSVLARPTKGGFFLPGFVADDDVWDQDDVSRGSEYDISAAECVDWARSRNLEIVFFDQNYQFDTISELRHAGVGTVGRFVWESFTPEHAKDAVRSLDVIYSFTRAEQRRYARMGIDSPRVPFGCHPELAAPKARHGSATVRLLYPAGYLSKRKPTGAVLEAFSMLRTPGVELTVKAQRGLRASDFVRPLSHREIIRRDHDLGREPVEHLGQDNVRVISENLETTAYRRLFASSDACIAVSRWEGLGLHLFEATALGVPLVVRHGAPDGDCGGRR